MSWFSLTKQIVLIIWCWSNDSWQLWQLLIAFSASDYYTWTPATKRLDDVDNICCLVWVCYLHHVLVIVVEAKKEAVWQQRGGIRKIQFLPRSLLLVAKYSTIQVSIIIDRVLHGLLLTCWVISVGSASTSARSCIQRVLYNRLSVNRWWVAGGDDNE